MNVRPAKKTIMYSAHASVSPSKQRTRGKAKSSAVLDEPDEHLGSSCMHDIIALQDIKRGEEILMSYGEDYWACRPNIICVQCTKHTTGDTRPPLGDDSGEDSSA